MSSHRIVLLFAVAAAGCGPATHSFPADPCSPNPCFQGVACTRDETAAARFRCGACPAGYTGDGASCSLADPCGLHPCFAGVTCTQDPGAAGGFRCGACPDGFTGDGAVCSDIDECAAGTATCAPDADCANLTPSYRCTCRAGFTGDGQSCTRLPDCSANPSICDPRATCEPAGETSYCRCGDGYQGDGSTCVDVNECLSGAAGCDPNADCYNEVPGYLCRCKAGFSGDGHTCAPIVTCSTTPTICDAHATCEPSGDSFVCRCGAGYAGDGASCADIDGCSASPCFPGVACTDVPAPALGFTCGACPAGTEGDGATCSDVDGCAGEPCFPGAACTDVAAPGTGFSCGACPAGYSGDGIACADVDECASATFTCDPNADCVNDDPSYHCVCREGFTGDGETCLPLAECAGDPGRCALEATCTPSALGPVCVCDSGYEGDGLACADVDGCAASPCFPGVACMDVPAPGTGHTCSSCPTGMQGDGATCAEIDGCALAPCHPGVACTDVLAPGTGRTCGPCPTGMRGDGASCTEIDGCALAPCFPGVSCADVPAPGTGFTCGACPAGMQGDGVTCTDFDACAANPCYTGVTCTDLLAPSTAFKCGACPAGFDGDGVTCLPLPDCGGGPGLCAAGAVCTDIGGGALRCVCGAGLTWEGSACADTDECARGTDTCGPHHVCQNQAGGYTCLCEPGYYGADDGPMCSKVVSSCAGCQLGTNVTCTDLGSGSYACVCKPGYLGAGVAADPCADTGLRLAWAPARVLGYLDTCVNGLALAKTQGGTAAAFAGEVIALANGSAVDFFLGPDCAGTPVTSVTAPAGAMSVALSAMPRSTIATSWAASNQLLGQATVPVSIGDGPPTALQFRNTATSVQVNACNAGTVGLSKSGGSQALENVDVNLTLSSTSGATLFSSASTCTGAAATLARTIPARTNGVGFYWRSATSTPATDTLRAVDAASVLATGTQDVAFQAPTPTDIDLPSSYYFEDTTTYTCHSGTVRVVDAAGNSIATPTALPVTITSSDARLTLYSSAGCGGSNTVTVAAGANQATFYMRASAFMSATLTATSALGSDATSVSIVDHCNHSCYPAGHPTCGSCSKCCSGVCGTTCR